MLVKYSKKLKQEGSKTTYNAEDNPPQEQYYRNSTHNNIQKYTNLS